MSEKDSSLNDTHEQLSQLFTQQRQHITSRLHEIESALEELSTAKEAYKLVGGLLVKKDAAQLREELMKSQHMLKIRLEGIQKQASGIRTSGMQGVPNSSSELSKNKDD